MLLEGVSHRSPRTGILLLLGVEGRAVFVALVPKTKNTKKITYRVRVVLGRRKPVCNPVRYKGFHFLLKGRFLRDDFSSATPSIPALFVVLYSP